MPIQPLISDFIVQIQSQTPPKNRTCYFDTEIRGFMLEHRPSGKATYYFRYRDAKGSIRMEHLGRLEEISLQEARVQAYEMRRAIIEEGDLPRSKPQAPLTLEEFIAQHYLPYAKSHKRSWMTDQTILKCHILPRFGAFKLHRLRLADVVEFQQEKLASGYAPGSCNRMVVLLKFIYNCAIRWEMVVMKNPCEGIALLEDNGVKERYLSYEEVRRLFRELDSTRHRQLGSIIRLLLYTGARKSEILNARWEEIDELNQLLCIPKERSKSKRLRTIPLSDAAMELIRSLPRIEGIPYLFFNPKTGKPPVAIFALWDKLRRRAGLGDVRLHDLRHSYASFLVNAGRSLYEVQNLLGHRDPKTTMRYAHLSPHAMLEAVNVMNQTLHAPSSSPHSSQSAASFA